MDNAEIARRLERLGLIMAIRNEDSFRVRSYRNAAASVRDWSIPLTKVAAEQGARGLQEIPGVGRAISGKIIDLIQRGTFDAWESIITDTPETVLDLLEVDGVNLKIAIDLYNRFRVSSLDDLKRFVEGGGLEMVDGVGEKTIERIKRSLRK